MKKLYKISVRTTIFGIPIYVKVEYVSLKERNLRYKVHTQFIVNGCNGYSHIEENRIITYYNIFKKSVFYYEAKHE